jgi:hypothetical protein
VYREPGILYLYDLSGRRPSNQSVSIWSGMYRDVWAVPPAPDPAPLGFEP